MAEILLTHSYMLKSDRKQFRIGQPYPPLGTLYAASVLKQNATDVCFYDTTFSKSPDQIIPLLQKEKPQILVIYDDGFSYLTKMCLSNMRKTAFRMIQLGQAFGSEIIVCSSDAMDNYSIYLEKGAGYVILGEGEITLKEIVGHILSNSGDNFDKIDGIAWKKDGQVCINSPRELIMNPDVLPLPAWELIDMEQYRSTWKKKNGYFTLNMVTTRGCPYNCIWCAKPIYGNHSSSRSPKNVVEEMIFLQKSFSPDHIWFTDDIFGLKPGWIEEFAGLIKDHNINLPFTIQARIDLLSENLRIPSLAAAGCKKIWLGIESGSQKILDGMQKGITVGQIYSTSPLIRDAGIEQAFFLQLGFPGETMDDIRKTIKLLTDLMPDDIGISVTYPLPGTKFYDSVKKEIESKKNWKDSDDLSPLIQSTFSQGFYKPLHHYIHKYFRYKQSIYYIRALFKNGSTLKRPYMRRILLMPYYFVFSLVYKMILRRNDFAAKRSI